MDRNDKFDREVWDRISKARSSLEGAMCEAYKLGYNNLYEQIHAAREPVLALLARCSEMSKSKK